MHIWELENLYASVFKFFSLYQLSLFCALFIVICYRWNLTFFLILFSPALQLIYDVSPALKHSSMPQGWLNTTTFFFFLLKTNLRQILQWHAWTHIPNSLLVQIQTWVKCESLYTWLLDFSFWGIKSNVAHYHTNVQLPFLFILLLLDDSMKIQTQHIDSQTSFALHILVPFENCNIFKGSWICFSFRTIPTDFVRLDQDILSPLAGKKQLYTYETKDFWEQIKTPG